MRQLLPGLCLLAFLAEMHGQNTPNTTSADFGGNYASLKPEQKALVDDWMKRFSATIGKPVEPESAYDTLPLSIKTTFNAVTHALISTHVTDASERSLGTAIQIVDKVDSVQGAIPGTRGDEQFRMYVQLKPRALEVLETSREFRRHDDNTVYHKGYPICYRSLPPVPSIQVSATRDQTRADVDVDYRSSGFPKALVNGHLTASNSDVRAGNNFETHNNQWQGFNDWWRSLLSLARVFETSDGEPAEKRRISAEPRQAAGDKPAEAVHDMLNTWLVERTPEHILSYFADESSYCAEVVDGEKVDHGMAKVKLLMAMQRANQRFGNVEHLEDISTALPPGDRVVRSRLVKQPYERQFALYDVREDAAEQFRCVNRADPSRRSPKAAGSKKFGKYYGAVFRLGPKGGAGGTTLATLWTRASKRWQLISYDVDPVWEEYRAPYNAPAPPPPAPTVYAEAPPDVVEAATKFLEAWLVKRDLDQAASYVSSKCGDCVKLDADSEEEEPVAAGGMETQLKGGLRRVTVTTGNVKRLDKAIAAPQPNHEDIKLVKHGNSKAFALVAIPEYMANALDCASRTAGKSVSSSPLAGDKSYGKHYATGLRVVKAGEDSGVLWAVWAREGAAWKIVSYTVLTP